LPPGLNVIGAGYAATQGDVLFDPVLLVEDAEVEGHTAGVSYVRTFSIADKRARIDVTVPWQNLKWTGLLDGEPASVLRIGLADPWVRLSVILAGAPVAGAPPKKSNTVIGAAIAVGLPLGEYIDEKLLNLGQNRFVVRPQIGVLHTRGKWSYELTGSTFLYGDNDDFLVDSTLEQAPLYAIQAHLIRTFERPGYWAALSAGYASGGQSTVDGIKADDSKRLMLTALAVGVPIAKNQGMKFAYIRSRTHADTGSDTDSLAIAWSYRF
jgi:Putative MetA-pathway of phenol degradation